MTVTLLIASLALLITGFARDAFPYTYGAIACAAMAAMILVLCHRTARSFAARQAPSRPRHAAVHQASSASRGRAARDRIERPRTSSQASSRRTLVASDTSTHGHEPHAASSLRHAPVTDAASGD